MRIKLAITKDITSRIKLANKEITLPGWVILFFTGFTDKAKSSDWLNNPGLSEEVVRFIVEMRCNAIGIDAPSPDVDIDHGPEPAHQIFPRHSVAIMKTSKISIVCLTRISFFWDIHFHSSEAVGAPFELRR